MKILCVFVFIAVLWISLPNMAQAPAFSQVPERAPKRARIAAHSAWMLWTLRRAGDLAARIAFIEDASARRRAAFTAAQILRSSITSIENDAGNTAVRDCVSDLANALERYDLPDVIAASERRFALEKRIRSVAP